MRDYRMKNRKNISIIVLLFAIVMLMSSCNLLNTSVDNSRATNVSNTSSQKEITKEMAYNGINN